MKTIRWSELLWMGMARSGKGYRKPSLRRSGRGVHRRSDKLAAAERPVSLFSGKLNFRRSDPQHPAHPA